MYIRIPLAVGVIYSADGVFKPKTISVNGEKFLIDKVLYKKNYCPKSVGAIAPIEFTIMVGGEIKKIYFEKDTGKWFSVKKILKSNEGKSYFTQ
ncbi:MAG: hypothetical protein IJD42_00195 [Clostridia bacterium]|nr:hypothetical protein [Clostridia bacterium]